MRTSREVYDRIRHDPRFDPARFVIGYEARLPEPKEIPFTAFVPNGELPWHRVLYFREGDTVVWDRRTRIDEVFGASAKAREAKGPAVLLSGSFFTPMALHRFDPGSGAWVEALPHAPLPAARGGARRLRVATWNVLSDEHERERVRTAERAPAIAGALEALDADVIALQEVSPQVFAALLSAPWVRRGYTLSEGPRSPALRAEGVLFLFRVPVLQLGVHAFSRAKRAVAAVLRAGEASVVVAQVHLPSDHTAGAARSRPARLTELLGALGHAGEAAAPAIVLGDFNWDAEDLDALFAAHGFADAWPAAGAAPAATFDPTRNTLAAIMSRTGRPARIDRVFCRDGMRSVFSTSASLFATGAIAPGPEPLFASDHFGVAVTLDLRAPGGEHPAAEGGSRSLAEGDNRSPAEGGSRSGEGDNRSPAEGGSRSGVEGGNRSPAEGGSSLRAPGEGAAREGGDGEAWGASTHHAAWGAPTHHTAVVIVPPAELWPAIQAIRGAHDRHATRWMPHVTLLYPFVPEGDLERARERLSEALSGLAPFEVTLAALGTFEHGHRDTVWARPDASPDGALHALHAALAAAFPACAARQRGGGAAFHPHLTLAQLDHAAPDAASRLAQWTRQWRPLRFPVGSVQVIVRHGESPFEVRSSVPFGAGARTAGAPHGLGAVQATAGEPPAAPEAGLAAARALPGAPEAGLPAAGTKEYVLSALRDACAYATPAGAAPVSLHVTGATRLGLSAGDDGDLDAVAVGGPAIARGAFFEAAREWLSGLGAEARAVTDAVAPVLRGTLGGAAFDLGLGRLPPGCERLHPCDLSPADLARTDPPSALALGAVRDAEALERALEGRVRATALADTVRSVKRWARVRGLYSNGFGYLSGFGWTLLAAWACLRPGAPDEPGALLPFVFRACADQPAGRAFAITEEGRGYTPRDRDVFVVPTPSAPVRNVARNVLRCTAAVLRAELARAAVVASRAASGAGPQGALLEPYEPERDGAREITVDISADSPGSLAQAAGWVEGHLLSILLQLEADGVPGLRPDPRPRRDPAATRVRFGIAFGGDQILPPRLRDALAAATFSLEAAFERSADRPADAQLTATVG